MISAESLIIMIKEYGRARRDDERYKEQGFDLEAGNCLEEIIKGVKEVYEAALNQETK